MAKLEKRQMIILGAMGIAVLYAAFDFLTPKQKASNPNRSMAQKTQELNTFVTDLTVGLGKDTTKALDTLIFSRAEKEWSQDPFLDGKSLKAWSRSKEQIKETATTAAQKIDFTYTGYLEANRKRMAIINGMEYREGDELDIKGYILTSISPVSIVIVNRATRAEQTVSLQE